MAEQLTEAQMQNSLKHAALQLGYRCYHTTYSIGSDAGFPDLHIVGHGRQFVFELKGPRGKLRPGQQDWIDAYREAGVDALVIWPDEYDKALDLLEMGYRAAMEGGRDADG
ncbi:MAG TPA: VRR-NUC domain-containing protein [Thermomicrobiales bacterium]|nr:VRR-NUC domain-containing protein [Thermomicrobiales bacterium]